jgi:hypothetical protein
MDITHNIFYSTVPYLTFWCLVIQSLYYIGPLRKFQDSVLVLTILVSIGGFIITYIHPKYTKVVLKKNGEKYEVKLSGKVLKLIDLACHQLPLVLLLYLYNPQIKCDNLLLVFTVLFVYFALADPINVYNFDCKEKYGKSICSLLLLLNILLIGGFFLLFLQKVID